MSVTRVWGRRVRGVQSERGLLCGGPSARGLGRVVAVWGAGLCVAACGGAPAERADGAAAAVARAYDVYLTRPNAAAAAWPELETDASLRDARLLERVAAEVESLGRDERFWRQIEKVVEPYHQVLQAVRAAGLPEVTAAIPYHEALFHSKAVSPVCAAGPWQLMPEVARRVGVEVRDCVVEGAAEAWSPTRGIPAPGGAQSSVYVAKEGGPRCLLRGCAVDERTDLAQSTRGALALLTEAWEHPLVRASGAAVQATVLSYNLGLDDARFEEKADSSVNLVPAYTAHLAAVGQDRDPLFVGRNLTCVGANSDEAGVSGTCGGHITNQAQHYVHTVIAVHMLASCYYARHHAELPGFAAGREALLAEGGPCAGLPVPEGRVGG